MFDEVSAVDEDQRAYWISKPWLKGACAYSVFMSRVLTDRGRLEVCKAENAHEPATRPTT